LLPATAGFLLDLHFNPEDGGSRSLRAVSEVPGSQTSSVIAVRNTNFIFYTAALYVKRRKIVTFKLFCLVTKQDKKTLIPI
jgi:hypothetical protein